MRYRWLDGAEALQRARRCAEAMRLLQVDAVVERRVGTVQVDLRRSGTREVGSQRGKRGDDGAGRSLRRGDLLAQGVRHRVDDKSVAEMSQCVVSCGVVMRQPVVRALRRRVRAC